MKLVKIFALLGLVLTLTACGGTPQTKTHTFEAGGKVFTATRADVPAKEGNTTWDVLTVDDEIVSIEKTNEGTTTAQDYGQTALAAATPAIINGFNAHSLQDKKCKDGGCDGGGNPVLVQVKTDVKNEVAANTCGSLCKRAGGS